jgi:hypothetical protein
MCMHVCVCVFTFPFTVDFMITFPGRVDRQRILFCGISGRRGKGRSSGLPEHIVRLPGLIWLQVSPLCRVKP